MESMTTVQSEEEIVLRKACHLDSSTSWRPVGPATRGLRSCSLIQALAPTPSSTAARAAQLRVMSDSHASMQDILDKMVCHSDSTEFDMPFGIDDDDLVNYQPPVLVSSRTPSVKYFHNRSSSKSFDLETFEEEDLRPENAEASFLTSAR